MNLRFLPLLCGCSFGLTIGVAGQPSATPQTAALNQYFAGQVEALEGQLEREVKTREDWLAAKDEYRRQLREMLGLDPLPERTDLKAVKTGEFEHDGIIVEKLHFQSLPGLYVTANLYRPQAAGQPLPAVLYLSGHAEVKKDGVSIGNKAGYEHHGVWYARHGFVCLILDTVQLGEIRGEHHGTYRLGRWWWISRGYTPAGVEAWNGMRALDYLETRPEVDKTRFGVAGRSGGGAYSWWVAALDERVKCAAPTAGITNLRNHIVDGCIEGHCDCMFMVNSYRWDFDKVAALVAPRALCILNTDKDAIFPIDGVFDVYQSVRRIYALLGAGNKLGLQVAEGPHKDMQPLNVGEFHWMMRHLQNADLMSAFDTAAVKSIPVEKLKVFEELPKDAINTRLDEIFVKAAPAPQVPKDEGDWVKMREGWMTALRENVLKEAAADLQEASLFHQLRTAEGLRMIELTDGTEFTGVMRSHGKPALAKGQRIWLVTSAETKLDQLDLVVLNVLDEEGWRHFANTFAPKFPSNAFKGLQIEPDEKAFEAEKKMHQHFKWGMAYVSPRGIGPSAWSGTEKEMTHRLRRFYLLGTTLETEQVRDIRDALRALRGMEGLGKTKWWVQASRNQAVNALYAALFEEGITRLDLHEVPASHREGPAYLNVLKHLDVPQAAAMVAEKTQLVIYTDRPDAWSYPRQVTENQGWSKQNRKRGITFRPILESDK